MTSDFLYENAPLAEVIAEVYWELTPLTAIPGAAIDPFFQTTSQNFQRLLAETGFSHVERLLPQDMPVELAPGQPLLRFRKSAGAWPLYQIGSGVFTCNIVPPYRGWAAFRQVIADGLAILFKSFPAPEHQFRSTLISLRYVDVFTKKHGFEDSATAFLRDQLGIRFGLPQELLDRLESEPNKVAPIFEARTPIDQTDRFFVVKAQQGLSDGLPAVVMELRISSASRLSASDQEVMRWFDEAHDVQHDIFDLMSSDSLKERMGPRRVIGGVA